MSVPPHMHEIISLLDDPKHTGDNEYQARCPAHEDKNPSLSIGVGENDKILLKCHAGCSVESIMQALELPMSALFPPQTKRENSVSHVPSAPRTEKNKGVKRIIYDYRSEDGALLFQVVRSDSANGKSFYQQAPDPQKPGDYKRNAEGKLTMDGVRRVLYNLPAVLKADTIFVVEGEKCAELLIERGIVATTSSGGAGGKERWKPEYTEALRGKNIRLMPDNDSVGRAHIDNIATQLADYSGDLRIIELPDLKDHGDIANWLEDGHTIEDLNKLVDDTPIWTFPNVVPATPEPEEAEAEASAPAQTGQSAAQILIEIGQQAELFCSERDDAYARFDRTGTRIIAPLRSQPFRNFLVRSYYEHTGKPPGSQALEDAMRVLGAKAEYDSARHSLSVRTAQQGNSVWYDLTDQAWRAIEITPNGWEIVERPPILFRRYAQAEAQVAPEPGGNLETLHRLINVRDEASWRILIVWLVAALLPDLAHPILIVHGEHGSAKSTLLRLLISLVDPSKIPLRNQPPNENEWILRADHAWCIGLDNLSAIPQWFSDALCRAVTGEGNSKRKLYSDDEDIIISFRRVIVLTGIEVVAQKADLLDRAILTALEVIAPENRRLESEVLAEFERTRPRILGALFDLVSSVLRLLPTIQMERLPRMADFARIGVAVEQALGWEQGSFMQAYNQNIGEQHEEAIGSSLVGETLRAYLEIGAAWGGSAKDLLSALTQHADASDSKRKDWPSNPKTLSGELRRLAPTLRAIGIDIAFTKPHGRRLITLTRKAL